MYAKNDYYINIIKDAGNVKKIITNFKFLTRKPKILSDNPNSTNAINFDDFFNKKVQTILNFFPKYTPPPPLIIPTFSFNLFDTISNAYIENLLITVKSKYMLDAISLYLFRPLSSVLSPYYKHIIDHLITSGIFPPSVKYVPVTLISNQNHSIGNCILSNCCYINKYPIKVK